MGVDQIGQFMAAIRQLESSNNYGAIGPTHATYGRALGAYQIMEANWAPWSRAAGIPDADWEDPAAQDFVARFQMLRYYAMFGDWDLVAVAWFAGAGTATKAQRDGIDTVASLSDVLGTSVSRYISLMHSNWSDEPIPRQSPSTLERINDVQKDKSAIARSLEPKRLTAVDTVNPKEMLRMIFSTLSDGLAGGKRLHIDDVAQNLRLDPAADQTTLRTAKKDEPQPEVEGGAQVVERQELEGVD